MEQDDVRNKSFAEVHRLCHVKSSWYRSVTLGLNKSVFIRLLGLHLAVVGEWSIGYALTFWAQYQCQMWLCHPFLDMDGEGAWWAARSKCDVGGM